MDAYEIVAKLEKELNLTDTHINTLYVAIEQRNQEIWDLLQQNEDLKRQVIQLIAENINTHAKIQQMSARKLDPEDGHGFKGIY